MIEENYKERASLVFFKNKYAIITILSLLISVLASFAPIYSVIFLIIIIAIAFAYSKLSLFFLYMVFFLMLQESISYNASIYGITSGVVGIIQKADDIIWILLFIIILIKTYKPNRWYIKFSWDIGIVIFLFILFSILSVLINRISIFWGMVAIILCIKGIIIYFIARNMEYKKKEIITFFNLFIYFLVFALFIGILQYLGLNIPFFPKEHRFGLTMASSVFAHHGVFGYMMGVALSLVIGLYFSTKNKKWLIYAFLFLIGLILSTVRRSLIGVSIRTLILIFNYKKFNINRKEIKIIMVIVIFITLLFGARLVKIAVSSKSEYLTNINNVPRYILYSGALKILKKKPVLGEGPGTYGSYISVVTSSKVYKELGINFWGPFYMDTYWPSIAGEYGIIGVILMVLLLYLIYRKILRLIHFKGIDDFTRGIIIGLNIISVDYIIESLTSQVYNASLSAFILFGFLGIVESYIFNSSNEDLKEIKI